MSGRIFVNGAGGRIGRGVMHEFMQIHQDWKPVVAVNEPRGIDFLVESYTERDSVHGTYKWEVKKENPEILSINGVPVQVFSEFDITKIPFRDMKVNLVMECSGHKSFGDQKPKEPNFPQYNGCGKILDLGVERVIQTYPSKTADAVIIMGVNHSNYDPTKHRIISNASCTTKALAAPLKVFLDYGVGIEGLMMDTTHAATATQNVLDSLGQIVTHSTGAAKATGQVIPSLEGKMFGMSYRVPTLDGSFANLYFVVTSEHRITAEIINNSMRSASLAPYSKGRLGIFEGKDAGTYDIVGRRENSVVITSKTSVIPLPLRTEDGKRSYLVNLISGYDNELGSAVDPVLLAKHVLQ